MPLPIITAQDIEGLFGNCKVVAGPFNGGQKLVYHCEIEGSNYALKFILIDPLSIDDPNDEDTATHFDEARERARREFDTLRICNIPSLIKPGPIELNGSHISGQQVIYFSEEWVNGINLHDYILTNSGSITKEFVINLGIDMAYAIQELWNHRKVHRDIKPQNIIKINNADHFILLDLGMVFDSGYSRLTNTGVVPGTPGYYSPEQFDLARKIDLDFRSDLFCLGIVMYISITGRHPFVQRGFSRDDIIRSILYSNPPPPHIFTQNISEELSYIIMRLLRKRPSERYNKITTFIDELTASR